MADRQRLIDEVLGLLDGNSTTAEIIVDGGIDLGGGRRIAIIEPMNDRSGQQIRFGDGLMAEQAWRLIVTPDPGESE